MAIPATAADPVGKAGYISGADLAKIGQAIADVYLYDNSPSLPGYQLPTFIGGTGQITLSRLHPTPSSVKKADQISSNDGNQAVVIVGGDSANPPTVMTTMIAPNIPSNTTYIVPFTPNTAYTINQPVALDGSVYTANTALSAQNTASFITAQWTKIADITTIPAYASQTDYTYRQAVTYMGAIWIAKADILNTPNTLDPTKWEKVTEQTPTQNEIDFSAQADGTLTSFDTNLGTTELFGYDLYLNGLRQSKGKQYVYSNGIITWIATDAPDAGDDLTFSYYQR